MRSILLSAAGALTLAACNQPPAPATEAPAAAEAGAEASTTAPMSAGGAAPAPAASSTVPGDGAVDTPTPPPVDNSMAGAPTSQATRDMAKEKAEETNLHPRTP
jgi:hypothetical protein